MRRPSLLFSIGATIFLGTLTLIVLWQAVSPRWNAQFNGNECLSAPPCKPGEADMGTYCYKAEGTSCGVGGVGKCGAGSCSCVSGPGLPECAGMEMAQIGQACDTGLVNCCNAGIPDKRAPHCMAGMNVECVNNICKSMCGNGRVDANEDCDGGDACTNTCSCPAGMKKDFARGCMCDPVMAGTAYCCEDLDTNHNGIIEDPSEAQVTSGLGEQCSGFICAWCHTLTCNTGVGHNCGSCPDEEGNYDPGCRCESPNLNGCSATFCSAPYTGDCDDRCDQPGEQGCYTVNEDGQRVKVGMYDGPFQCFNDVCAIPREGGAGGGYTGNAGTYSGGMGGDNTGGAAGDDGGGDTGDGGSGGNNGGSNSSTNSSRQSSSSSKDCNDTNPCIATTVVNGNLSYTVPVSCPLEGNQEACYTQCIDTINRTHLKIDCNAQCGVDDGDLKMCPCNPDNQQCVLGCMTGYMACNTSCGNNQTCKSQCSTQYRSCLDGCGRACPASSSGSNGSNSSGNSNSSKSGSSNTSKGGSSSSRSGSSTSNGSNGSNNSNGSQNSSGSNRSGSSSSASNKSNSNSSTSASNRSNSNSSTSASNRSNSNSSTSASNRSNSNSSISHNSSNNSSASNNNSSASNNSSNNSNSSHTSNRSSSSSNTSLSSRSNISQSSSISSLTNGVCCEAGNCNPFGSCSNPFVNYAACKIACGVSSTSSRMSSTSSSSTSSSRSSLSSSFSSSSSLQSSSAFSDDQHSSQHSNGLPCNDPSQCASGVCINGICTENSSARSIGLPCTEPSQCASGACINGICIDTTSSRIAVAPRPRSSVSNIACLIDGDCPSGTRCILNRCLTVTEIAQLPPFCGNARPDVGEQCDLGAENSDRPNAYCRPDCTLGRCGDGIIDTPLELCDDGNSLNNDGCSAACLVERAAPPTTLPATTIELPFVNKGDVGSNTDDRGSNVGGISTESDQPGVPSSVPSTPDTGPAALAIMIAGGAAGWLYRRRKV